MAVSQESNPFGVGISRQGKHPRVLSYRAYRTWQQMLQRCYSPKAQVRQSTYVGCTVCPEWLEYQQFADWYVQQRGAELDWQLDKDLLASRMDLPNNIYSPETCLLLPEILNKTLAVKQNKLSSLPTGVSMIPRKTKVTFVAKYMNEYGENTHIGTYTTMEEASTAYTKQKQSVLTFLVGKYRELLDTRATHILNNYFEVSQWQ